MIIRSTTIARTVLGTKSFLIKFSNRVNHMNNRSTNRNVYFLYQTKKQTSAEQLTHEQNVHSPQNLIPFNELTIQIQKDITNSYSNYSKIKSSFIHHLSSLAFNNNSQHILIKCLSLLKKYPCFPLTNHQLLQIYKIICLNLHLKSVQDLNHLLEFVLIADQFPSQSPIFLQFIKFYVQVPLQYYKTKYQIDLQKLSLLQAFKQFIGRSVQRGFFPRSPPYTRNLNVLEPQKILYLLAQLNSTEKSLMLKKLNYTIFMDIKTFYEQEMHQNLYHHKKVQLMRKFNNQYMQVLAKQIPIINHEVIYLRQLYMKLYLTLPQYDCSNQIEFTKNENLRHQFSIFKIKNIIFLYNLSLFHLKRIDHLKLQQITQNIDIIIQFVQQVDLNLKYASQSNICIKDYHLDFKQIIQLLFLLNNLNLQKSSLYQSLLDQIKLLISPFYYHLHFNLIISLIKIQIKSQHMPFFLQNPDFLELLDLKQLKLLSQLINKSTNQKLNKTFQILFENILNKILSTDFQVVNGQIITIFLHIFQKSLITYNNQHNSKCQSFRVFILRYISDHHQEFSLLHFQQIINKILDLPDQLQKNFDDHEGNYPNHILQELDTYLDKVLLLMNQNTRHRLQDKRHINRPGLSDNY